jgi:hypothetical protein
MKGQKLWPLVLMELVIKVSTIIRGMLICLWRTKVKDIHFSLTSCAVTLCANCDLVTTK